MQTWRQLQRATSHDPFGTATRQRQCVFTHNARNVRDVMAQKLVHCQRQGALCASERIMERVTAQVLLDQQ